MNCPACKNHLTERTVGGVAVDVCDGGCGGIWFDKNELLAFDEPHESAGIELLDVVRDPDAYVDKESKRGCPRCEQYVMQRHFFSVKMQVEVDECPGCGGYWLDAGELAGIRSLFDTEDERNAAAKSFWNEVYQERMPELEREMVEELSRSRRIANMFRYLCPSTWLPGKQSWGSY